VYNKAMIDIKDLQALEDLMHRARIKETVTVEMMERRFDAEREDLKLIISKYEDQVKSHNVDVDARVASLLKSYQTQLVAVSRWERAYDVLQANYDTQKEIIEKLQANVDKLEGKA